jgi:hypothetical protein
MPPPLAVATPCPATLAEPPKPSRKQSWRCSLPERATSLLTPLELFYGIRPNYRILYKLGIFVGLLEVLAPRSPSFPTSLTLSLPLAAAITPME